MALHCQHTAAAAAALLLLPLLAAHAQDLPPQCDQAFLFNPVNIFFLGPVREVQVGDIKYSYHRFGKADGGKPPLVLIQGMGALKYNWPLTMLEELQQSREVVIFDNALAGQSVDALAGQRSLNLTIPFMAQSTVDLIAALKFGTPPDVLGLSMGGMIVLWMAAHHGSAVRSVVAVGATYGGKDAPQLRGGINAMLNYLASAQGAFDFSVLLPLGVSDPGYCHVARDYFSTSLALIPGFWNISGAGYAVGAINGPESLIPPSFEVRAKQADAIRTFYSGPGLLTRLARSNKQILWISGTQDAIFPIVTQTRGASATPGSWVVQTPDAGHVVTHARPAQFAEQVAAFLDAVQTERMTCQQKDANCAQCEGPAGTIPGAQCRACRDGFKFLGPKCQPKTCLDTDANCAECAGAVGSPQGTQCKTCKPNYKLDGAISKKCRLKTCSERGFANCIQCNTAFGCTKCAIGFSWDGAKRQCVKNTVRGAL